MSTAPLPTSWTTAGMRPRSSKRREARSITAAFPFRPFGASWGIWEPGPGACAPGYSDSAPSGPEKSSFRLLPDRKSRLRQRPLHLAHGVGPLVEDRGGEHGGGPGGERLRQVLRLAGPARCDHRHRHAIRDLGDQVQIVPALRTVAVDARQQHLARAAAHRLADPAQRVEPGRPASALGDHFPSTVPGAASVHGEDNALAAEAAGPLPPPPPPPHGGGG